MNESKTPGDLLRGLVAQISKSDPVDDHGHKFVMNNAYIKAVEWLDGKGARSAKLDGLEAILAGVEAEQRAIPNHPVNDPPAGVSRLGQAAIDAGYAEDPRVPCATCGGRGIVARSFHDGDNYDACPECNMPNPERAAAAPVDELTAFETRFSRFDLRPSVTRVGHYNDLRVEFMWEAWQARAALPQSPRAAEPVAWMYSNETHGAVFADTRWTTQHAWTETPLYAAPAAMETVDARLTEALDWIEKAAKDSRNITLVDREMVVIRAALPQSPRAAPVDAVYMNIRAERARQDEQWGGPEHDDEHTPWDWARLIECQTDWGREKDPWCRFVKIAALAVAAIESIERKKSQTKPADTIEPKMRLGKHHARCPMASPGNSERLWNCVCGLIRDIESESLERKKK